MNAENIENIEGVEEIKIPQKNKGYVEDIKSLNANLTWEETEILAGEIRHILIGNNAVTMPDFIKAAKKVNSHILGYRLSNAIIHENNLAIFLPDEVLDVFRDNKPEHPVFNDYDLNWISINKGKGLEWLSNHCYAPRELIREKAKKINIVFNDKSPHTYTPEDDDFILKNVDKGWKWIGEQFKVSADAIQHRVSRLRKKNKTVEAQKEQTVQNTVQNTVLEQTSGVNLEQ